MKKLSASLALFITLMVCLSSNAQKSMASPRDTVSGTIGNAHVIINYGSPAVKDRKIWGKLVPYGKVWRTGANEATIFKTDKPLKIEGKELPAGEYALFTIPSEDEWIIIFNKASRQWGSFEYQERDDVLRVSVKPQTSEQNERLVFKVAQGEFQLAWEKLKVPVKVTE